MVIIKDNKYFITPGINVDHCVEIDKVDEIDVDLELFDKEPVTSKRYIIENNKFVEYEYGNWSCKTIYWRKNIDKKFYEFWKPDRLINKVSMIRFKTREV